MECERSPGGQCDTAVHVSGLGGTSRPAPNASASGDRPGTGRAARPGGGVRPPAHHGHGRRSPSSQEVVATTFMQPRRSPAKRPRGMRPAGCAPRGARGHCAPARLAPEGPASHAARRGLPVGGRVFPAPAVSVLQGEGRDLRSLVSRLMTREINTPQRRTGKLLDELIWEPGFRRRIRPGFPGWGGHTHGPLSFLGIGVFVDKTGGLDRDAGGL